MSFEILAPNPAQLPTGLINIFSLFHFLRTRALYYVQRVSQVDNKYNILYVLLRHYARNFYFEQLQLCLKNVSRCSTQLLLPPECSIWATQPALRGKICFNHIYRSIINVVSKEYLNIIFSFLYGIAMFSFLLFRRIFREIDDANFDTNSS